MTSALLEVRKKLIDLMRADPPFKLVPTGAGGLALERWMATRLDREDLLTLQRLEELYGEVALAELLTEALFEAGVVRAA